MNKTFKLSVLLLTTFPSIGMEKTATVPQSNALSKTILLCSPEVRSLIIDYLLRTESFKKAISSLKALSITDNTAVQLFNQLKEEKESLYFIEYLEALSRKISNTFDLSEQTLTLLEPLLNKEVCDRCKQGIYKRDTLIEFFKSCKDEQEWKKALEMLEDFKKNSLSRLLSGAHFDGFYTSRSAEPRNSFWGKLLLEKKLLKKDLCVCALEQQAPSFIIESILSDRTNPEGNHWRFLSPFLLAFHLFLNCSEKDRLDLEKSLESLILKESSINTGFRFYDSQNLFHYQTPLLEAIQKQNNSAVRYLLSKGASFDMTHIERIVHRGLLQGDTETNDILYTILPKDNLRDFIALIMKFNYMLLGEGSFPVETLELVKKRSEEIIQTVLDSYAIDLGLPLMDGFECTLLELARIFNDKSLGSLFIKYGAPALSREGLKNACCLKGDLLFKQLRFLPDGECIYDPEKSFLLTESQKVLREIMSFLLEGLPTENLLFSGLALALYILETPEAAQFILFLQDQKSLVFQSSSYGNVSSPLHLIGAFISSYSFTEEESEMLQQKACPFISRFMKTALKDSPNAEGKTAVEKACELHMNTLATYLKQVVEQNQLEIERVEKERRKALIHLKGLLVENKLKNLNLYSCCLLWQDSSCTEAREVFKFMASKDQLLLKDVPYGDIPSVLHLIVAVTAENRSLLTQSCSLVDWLIKEGVLDRELSNGKTAAQRAEELGLKDLSDCMKNAA